MWISIFIFTSIFDLTAQQWISEEGRNSNVTTVEEESDKSYLFQVQLELKTTKIDEPFEELEKRIEKLVVFSFEIASYKHIKQEPPAELNLNNSEYNIEIIKKRVVGDVTYINFIVYANGKPIMGEVVTEDLHQMTSAQISAALHYPLNKISSHVDIEDESRVKWWLIVAILGSGALIFLIGWISLFIYYNTCGSSHKIDEGDYMSRADRAKLQKGIIINPNPPWARGIYDHPLGEPWVDPGPVSTVDGKIKEPKYKKSFRTLSEAQLEKRLKEEREAMAKAMTDIARRAAAKTKAWEESQILAAKEKQAMRSEGTKSDSTSETEKAEGKKDPENKKSHDTKKRKPKVEPITSSEPSSEISGISSDEATKGYAGFSTLGEVPIKKKITKSNNINSEPETEFGSSTFEEAEHQKLEDSKRPNAAGKDRTRLFSNEDGNAQKQITNVPKVWTPYSAGDFVSFWSNNPNCYPHPASPTQSGIIEFKSREKFA